MRFFSLASVETMREPVAKLRFGVVFMILFSLASLPFTSAFLSGLGKNKDGVIGSSQLSHLRKNHRVSSPHRKLLIQSKAKEEPNRLGEKCTKGDIVISQGPTAPLSNGIPTYTVQIVNMCATGCDISRIHLTCGWFSSASLINPKIFKRVRYNDCLVNDGKPLVNGGTLSFEYANTFRYPLSVSSVAC